MEATAQREDPKMDERQRAVTEASLKKSSLKYPKMPKKEERKIQEVGRYRETSKVPEGRMNPRLDPNL